MKSSSELIRNAWKAGWIIPSFNIPYLPMMERVVQALRDNQCFGFIAVARLEWEKFEAKSLKAVRDEYQRVKDDRFTRLHLDHVPVIDEDGARVHYEAIIREAIELGYQSVMVDGSRLSLEDNIAATRRVVALAHPLDIPVEGELGTVWGHEDGPWPDYEEMWATGKGFTDPRQAACFVSETGVDWLAVAIGNIHGAISKLKRHEKKIEARLNMEHLDRLAKATSIPLVLHGGSGIRTDNVLEAMRHGIAKINMGTTIRQPYEAMRPKSLAAAQRAVYHSVCHVIRDELHIGGSVETINPS